MQRCKKNREDSSRVICLHLLPVLLCTVEDQTQPLTWSSSKGKSVTKGAEACTACTAGSSHSLLKQDGTWKWGASSEIAGKVFSWSGSLFWLLISALLYIHSKTVRWEKPNKQTGGNHQEKAKEKKTKKETTEERGSKIGEGGSEAVECACISHLKSCRSSYSSLENHWIAMKK